MNVTALLDVPALRSASPLDSAVGGDASDPAFANVMSQYQDNDNDSLAAGVQNAPAGPNGDVPQSPVETTHTPVDAAAIDPAAAANAANADPGGGALPLPIIVNGQMLPPIDAASVGTSLPGTVVPPKPDDGFDTTDSSAAAVIAVAAPVPPPVASTPGVASVTAPPADSTVDVAARGPLVQLPVVTSPPTDAGTDAASAAPDQDPAPELPPVDPARAIKKDGEAAALTKATVSPGMPMDDDTALRSGSVVHALRAFGLGHGQPSAGNGSPNPGGGQSRDPNGASRDPLRGDGPPKISNVQLAAAIDAAAAQKDPAAVPHDTSESSIRTDAVSQRANGPVEGARDSAATRLGDLAQQHAPRFAAELADRVLVLRSQRFDSATVSLEPRDLGRIDIQVRLQADTTHVAFTTQHAAVRDALEGQMPRLRAMLEEAGLSLGAVDISQSGSRGTGDTGTARSYAQPPAVIGDPDAIDSPAGWQRRVETSLIDLHA